MLPVYSQTKAPARRPSRVRTPQPLPSVLKTCSRARTPRPTTLLKQPGGQLHSKMQSDPNRNRNRNRNRIRNPNPNPAGAPGGVGRVAGRVYVVKPLCVGARNPSAEGGRFNTAIFILLPQLGRPRSAQGWQNPK